MIVTIDGPAGTGKSTVARGLAESLGFHYLDTGAMYRAVALACLQRGVDPANEVDCAELVDHLQILVDGRRTELDGHDVTEAIRSPEATVAASIVAQHPEVRTRLVRLQRDAASTGSYVCEGRDQGTVVFPQAKVKFYLTASEQVRAERRRLELAERGEVMTLDALLAQQSDRDRRDRERAIAPLRPADDAILIDTSGLSPAEVIDRMHVQVRQRMKPT